MQQQEQASASVALSVHWVGQPDEDGHETAVEDASAYAATLARALMSMGYHPRALDIALRLGPSGTLEIGVRGHVPSIPEPDFVSLARVTLTATTLRRGFGGEQEPQLIAAVLAPPPAASVDEANSPPPAAEARPRRPIGWITVGIGLGLLLGILGLPRLDVPWSTLLPRAAPFVATSTLDEAPVAEQPLPATIVPTLVPTVAARATSAPLAPAPTVVTVSATPVPRVLFAQPLAAALPGWTNDPEATAWFTDGGYRLVARQPGRFVAVGVPLPEPLGNGLLNARFRKLGGPSGGGYGVIVRDQGTTSERDGYAQTGQYLALEVGDQGDVGVWRREGTRWIDIMPWTHSAAVHAGGEPNALSVTTLDGALRFEVNGQVVADLSYTGLPNSGGVGILVGGDLNQVALESLRIEATH